MKVLEKLNYALLVAHYTPLIDFEEVIGEQVIESHHVVVEFRVVESGFGFEDFVFGVGLRDRQVDCQDHPECEDKCARR